MQHPAVLEAAVIGIADEQGLTRARAYVVLKDPGRADDAFADELRSFVKSRLAPHKYPRLLEFVARAAEDGHRQDPALSPARAGPSRFMSRPQRVGIEVSRRRLQIEVAWVGAEAPELPLLVFLHEGLGSLAMWKDFPARLCDACGVRGLRLFAARLRRVDAAPGRRALGRRLHARPGRGRAAGAARARSASRRRTRCSATATAARSR